MSWFRRLFSGEKPAAAAPPAAPRPAPEWLEVDGEFVDLHALTAAQREQLEAVLHQRHRQREQELMAHLLGLAAERERLLALNDPGTWVLTLKLMFGEELGRRVAIQHIVAGMQLQHLILSFGRPDRLDASGGVVRLAYGEPEVTSYFEVEGDTIRRALVVAPPPLPPGFRG